MGPLRANVLVVQYILQVCLTGFSGNVSGPYVWDKDLFRNMVP